LSMSEFFQDSVIWLAKPSDSPRPLWRAPSHKAIPSGQQVHTLDSFLAACGWLSRHVSDEGQVASISRCSWVQRGIVFVDDSTSVCGEDNDQGWLVYPLGALLERKRALLELGRSSDVKPVWVFSMKLLAREKTDGSCVSADPNFQSQALCRL